MPARGGGGARRALRGGAGRPRQPRDGRTTGGHDLSRSRDRARTLRPSEYPRGTRGGAATRPRRWRHGKDEPGISRGRRARLRDQYRLVLRRRVGVVVVLRRHEPGLQDLHRLGRQLAALAALALRVRVASYILRRPQLSHFGGAARRSLERRGARGFVVLQSCIPRRGDAAGTPRRRRRRSSIALIFRIGQSYVPRRDDAAATPRRRRRRSLIAPTRIFRIGQSRVPRRDDAAATTQILMPATPRRRSLERSVSRDRSGRPFR